MLEFLASSRAARHTDDQMPQRWLSGVRKPTSRADAMALIFENDAYRAHIHDRFMSRVIQGAAPDDCWGWRGSTASLGYGRISMYKGVEARTSRISYALFIGPIGADLVVCHRCDNPVCSNPRHLFLGSNADNIRDMDRKGRSRRVGTPNRNCSKLTEDQVRYIRSVYIPKSKEFGTAALGRSFGVSQATVSFVVTRQTWADVA